MADDLKRVGLVFKADGTTDFQKSLTTINSLTQENYANFKLVQSQYDKTTSSLTKLKNQQNYLSQNTELYKTKVSVLKEELNELENAEDRNEKAIANKKKQIANAQTTLNNYEKGLKEVSDQLESGSAKIKEYAESIESASEKISAAGNSMTKNVTAPIAAVGAASMVAWNEIDEAYDNIILKTGATGDALENLKNSFDNVYGTMPTDSETVSNAIGEVNTRFKLTGKELENLSKYMIQFAEITGSDVTQSTAYAQRIQGQWNLSIEETKNVLGLVAKQSQDTGISVDTLMSNVTANATTFKEMNLSVDEAVNLMAQFESAGLENDSMLTGLKKASQNYAKEGKSMSNGLGDLVKRLKDSTTYQEAYNEVVDLFGSKNALAFATACKEGKMNLSDLSSSLGDYSNVVAATFEGTLDPVDKAKTSLNNIKIVGADLADTIQGALAPVLEKISILMKDFANWFKNLNPEIKRTIIIISGIVASIGPLLVVIGTLGTQMSKGLNMLANLKLMLFQENGAIAMLKTAIAGLSGTMLAIIGVITLVSVAILDLWKNNEDFRKNVISIANNIGSIVKTLYNSILKPIIAGITELVKSIWDNCLKPLYENVKLIIAVITQKMSEFIAFITPIVNLIVQLFGVIVKNVLQNILLPIFQTVFSKISNLVSTGFIFIQKIWNSILKPVFNAISSLIQNVLLPIFTITFAAICSAVKGTFNGIKFVWSSVLKPVFDGISQTIQWLSDKFSNIFGGIYDTTSRIFGKIRDAMTGPIETAKNLIKGIVDTIKGFFSFKISFPKIPLPHFSIKPKGWGIGDLLKGKIPRLGIDWYNKAMDKGMILDSATIFGMNNKGQLMGGGESGSETIVGTQSLMDMIKNAAKAGNDELLNVLMTIANRLSPDNLYKVIVKAISDGGFVIVLDNREVGRIVKKYA